MNDESESFKQVENSMEANTENVLHCVSTTCSCGFGDCFSFDLLDVVDLGAGGPVSLEGDVNFHFINKPHAAFSFSCVQKKGNLPMDPKSEWHQGVWPWGIQIGSNAIYKTNFWNVNFLVISQPHGAFSFTCIFMQVKRNAYIGAQKWMTPRGVWS